MTKELRLNKEFTLITNLLQTLEIDEAHFINLLLAGDLYGFEEALYKFVMYHIYDMLAETFIKDVIASHIFEAQMRQLAAASRMGKLQKRTVNLQCAKRNVSQTRSPICAGCAEKDGWESVFMLALLGRD